MNPKKIKERRERILRINLALKKLFPTAATLLNFKTPLELLVAVQLSARCTDRTVNKITEKLFKKYKKLNDYAKADPLQFEQDIKSSGFYRNKTKNILGAVRTIKKEFGGKVPKRIEDILRIPGVGRKTATVVLKEAYGVVAGITVDTHVIRFVGRFDLSDFKDPVRIEKDLMQILPKKEWGHFTNRVIRYGRYHKAAHIFRV